VNAGLLSTGQVAQALGVHRSTVWHWIQTGVLRHTKHGSHYGIKPADVDRILDIYKAPLGAKWKKKRRQEARRLERKK
jgi:excisionase family DNA binding protein